MPDVETAASSPATGTETVEAPKTGFAAMTPAERADHAFRKGFEPPAERKKDTTEAASSTAPAGAEARTEAESAPATKTEERPTRQQLNFANLRKQKEAAEARAADLERQLAEHRKSAPGTKEQPKVDLSDLKEPSLDDEKYAGKANAFELWQKDQRVYDREVLRRELKAERDAEAKAREESDRKKQETERDSEIKAAWKRNYVKQKEADKELDRHATEVAKTIRDADVLPLMDDLVELDEGPALCTFLASHADEFDGLIEAYSRSEKSGRIALGKLMASMKAPQPKTLTEAPPPPRSAGGKTAEPADELQAAIKRGKETGNYDDMNRILNKQRGLSLRV